jgi:hypothetical protein
LKRGQMASYGTGAVLTVRLQLKNGKGGYLPKDLTLANVVCEDANGNERPIKMWSCNVRYLAGASRTCSDVWAMGLGLAADLNRDCHVTFADLAIFASDWLVCDTPHDPHCIATW